MQAGCNINRNTFVAVHCTKQISGGFDTDAVRGWTMSVDTIVIVQHIVHTGTPCAPQVELGGGEKIVICSNYLESAKEVASTMRHELIHAYDHCMAGGLDWTDLNKRACSEVGCCDDKHTYLCLL